MIQKLTDIWIIAFTVLGDILRAMGYIAAGFVIWGGIKYTKSQGNPAELTAARTIIYNALLGFVISLMSVAIIQFVAGTF